MTTKIEKSRIAAALFEKVCVYSIKEGKFANVKLTFTFLNNIIITFNCVEKVMILKK